MAITKLQPFNLDTTANYTFANVTASNVNGANLISANYVTGTLTTATQPNITSTGTLVNLTVSGNAAFSGANVTLGAVGNVRITGGSNGQYLQTDGSGTLTWSTVASGSTSNISNGNSNVNIPSANGNVNISSAGNANIVVVTGTGVNIAGTLNTTGNTTVGNLFSTGSGGNISNVNVISANTFVASGNITAGNINTTGSGGNIGNANVISANTFTASGNITASNANLGNAVTANFFIGSGANLTSIPGGNVSGQVANALVSGTVYTAAQPNITSLGTLTGLTSTGTANLIGASNVSLGPVGNVKITGGSNGQYLQTDGSGTLTWSTVASGASSNISNGNSNVNIPSANGNVNISSAGNANIVVVTGTGVNIAGTLNATGNASLGNLVTTGSGGNISNANVISANTLIASGNITAGNINTTGSGGNIGNANVISANTFIASGNITSGNANLGNNVTANFFTGNLYGTANLATYATTANAVAGGNVSGQVANALISGTVYTNAQPNITSVGTLTSLTVTGNVTGGNLVTAGKVYASEMLNGGTGIYLSAGPSGYINFFTTGGDKASISDTGNIIASNVIANSTVFAVTANVSGNVNAGNANLGNNVTANFFTGNGSLLTGITVSAGNTIVNGNSNVLVSANGNVTTSVAGNANILIVTGTGVNVAGTLNVTGNATVGNIVTSGSGGNVSNVNVISANTFIASGNVTGGNLITGGLVSATGNVVTSANVVTDLIVGKTSGITITATGTNQNINLTPTGTGTVNVGNFIISNVATPVASTDAATKQYVDDVAQGLHTHDSCNAATQTTLASISGGTVTYNNGTSGVGATLTTTGTYTTIDGVTLSVGMRILVKNEVTTANNGIYDVTSSTVLTRSADFNTPVEMAGGDFTFVTAGTLYDNTGWVMPDPVTTVGTSSVVWVQFSGAGTYTAGTGLTLVGSQFNISNTTVTAGSYGNGDAVASFTVNGQGQLTAASAVAITSNAANLTGTTLNSTIVNSSLTSVGTLSNLTVTGNATVGNIVTSGSGGNVSNVNVISANTFIASGNITAANANLGNLTTANFFTGTLTTAAQPNITSVGTLSSLTVSGNILPSANITYSLGSATQRFKDLYISGSTIDINGATITANASGITLTNPLGGTFTVVGSGAANTSSIVNGNSNVDIPSANGNVNISAVGNANIVVVTGTGANITGTLNVTGNANLGNAVTANFFIGNLYGTANLATYATTANSVALANVSGAGNIASINLDGNVSNLLTGAGTYVAIPTASSNANYANFAGTVITNAQPNITSVGSLTGLTVSNVTGDVTFTNTATVSLGAVANLRISGGSNGQVLTTNGSSGLTWTTVSGGGGGGSNIANGTSNVNIPTADGNVNTSVGGTANVFVVTSTGANVSGNLTASNISAGAGAGGSITGANLISANYFTGQLSNGNSNINIASVNGNVSISAIGNANVLVVTGTGANITGTANITGNTVVGNLTAGAGSGGSITGANYISANYFYGTLTSGASSQPNLTSLGTLAGLNVSNASANMNFTVNLANFANTSNVYLGAVSNVHIANGTANYFLQTNGAGDLTWAQAIPIITDSDASSSTFYPVYATSTSGGFLTAGITSAKLQFVPSTGQLTVQDLNTLSDATLKENPEAIENPIEILMQLFGMGFNWVDSKKKSYGLMAQMVEKILPELVSTNAQGKKAVNYIPIIAFLIEAVKKQQEDIEALKKR
jgi:hypothetical protein